MARHSSCSGQDEGIQPTFKVCGRRMGPICGLLLTTVRSIPMLKGGDRNGLSRNKWGCMYSKHIQIPATDGLPSILKGTLCATCSLATAGRVQRNWCGAYPQRRSRGGASRKTRPITMVNPDNYFPTLLLLLCIVWMLST